MFKNQSRVINCYKILEVPDFSNPDTVRKSYLSLAKKHHPDVARNSDGERFKIISKAYDTLSDPKTKRFHDQKLRYYQEVGSTPSPGPFQPRRSTGVTQEELRKRKMRSARQRLKNDMAYYRRQNEQLPYKYRVIGWAVISFLGWELVYQNWFVNEDAYDHVISFIGFIVFVTGSVGVLSILYKLYRYLHFSTERTINFFRRSGLIWLGFLFIGLFTLPTLSTVRKNYHLKHYGRYSVVNYKPKDLNGSAVIEFKPPNYPRQIIKRITITPDHIFNSKYHWVLVRYSDVNPRILEVVHKEDYHEPDPLK